MTPVQRQLSCKQADQCRPIPSSLSLSLGTRGVALIDFYSTSSPIYSQCNDIPLFGSCYSGIGLFLRYTVFFCYVTRMITFCKPVFVCCAIWSDLGYSIHFFFVCYVTLVKP